MGISLSQAIEGFLLEQDARRLSPHTISDYALTLRRFRAHLPQDPPFDQITADDVRRFLASLAEPQPQPGAVSRPPMALGNKTIRNAHTSLAALWTWAVRERIATRHVLREVPRPKANAPAISILSQDDMQRLMAATDRTAGYKRPGKRLCDNRRPTALRDRAILLLLLDTGIRASELTDMRVADVDIRNRRITVTGKGSKTRHLPISPETARAIWRYLTEQRSNDRITAALFATDDGQDMSRLSLLQLLNRLGKRAGVSDVHPHRFRHTFAVLFLRNGGNAFELQMALGHTSLNTVQIYLHLAQTDLDEAHREASPVAGWRLGR